MTLLYVLLVINIVTHAFNAYVYTDKVRRGEGYTFTVNRRVAKWTWISDVGVVLVATYYLVTL